MLIKWVSENTYFSTELSEVDIQHQILCLGTRITQAFLANA